MAKISILDLTAGQVEAIEKDFGLPVNRWPEADSLVGLYIKVLATVNGDGEERYRAMPIRELLNLVDLNESDDPNQ